MAYPVSLGPVSQSAAWVRTAATANETRHRNPVNPSEQAGARPASPTNFARDGAPIKEGRPRLYQIILVLQAKPTAISITSTTLRRQMTRAASTKRATTQAFVFEIGRV